MHDYQQTCRVSGGSRSILLSQFEYAHSLLPNNFQKLLNRRYHGLYNLDMELVGPPGNNQDLPTETENGMYM